MGAGWIPVRGKGQPPGIPRGRGSLPSVELEKNGVETSYLIMTSTASRRSVWACPNRREALMALFTTFNWQGLSNFFAGNLDVFPHDLGDELVLGHFGIVRRPAAQRSVRLWDGLDAGRFHVLLDVVDDTLYRNGVFPGCLLFGGLVCECPPSDARPFVWRVEHLISSLRNDCTLRDSGMTRRCLHKVLACLHLGYQCKIARQFKVKVDLKSFKTSDIIISFRRFSLFQNVGFIVYFFDFC